MKISYPLTALVAATALSGCPSATLITSSQIKCGDQKCDDGTGFVYALPEVQFVLNASRTAQPPSDLTAAAKTFADAADKFSAAQAAVVASQTDLATKIANLAAATQKLSDDKAKPASADVIKADQAAVDSGSDATKAAKTTLASAQVTAQVYKELFATAKDTFTTQRASQGMGLESATLIAQPVAADPKTRYVAYLDHKCSRDDDGKISVVNGLLASATTTSTDQRLALLSKLLGTGVSLAAFAISGVPLVPPVGGALAAPEGGQFPQDCVYNISETFDPLDKDDVKRVNDLLRDTYKSSFVVDVKVGTMNMKDIAKEYSQGPPNASGLVYRVPVPATVTVRATRQIDACPLKISATGQGVVAVIPDTRSSYVIAAEGGSFTKTQLSYTFSNGMLTDFSATQPSEAAAIVAVPVDLANQILSIPGSIFKLRLDYTNNVDAQVKANTALTNDTAALTKAINDAKAAQTTSATAAPAATATPAGGAPGSP